MTALHRFILPAFLLLGVSLAGAQADAIIPDAHLTFTTIDVPGYSLIQIDGINSAGDMVGFYGQNGSGPVSGFLYRNGSFTFFDYPGQPVTVPNGINDSGLIVGYATQTASQEYKVVGFLYDGTSFTTLQDGNNQETAGQGINNAGVVVGRVGTLGTTRGFMLLNGRYEILQFPGQYVYGLATGINNFSEVTGYTDYDAYIYKNGKFRKVDFPGAQLTAAMGVNDGGIVVGWYNPTDTNEYHGFVRKGGKFISFSYPGAVWTFALGINNSGQIVGAYTFDKVIYHGFLTSPVSDVDFE
jgi:probable HAF family extracellular repeat protein